MGKLDGKVALISGGARGQGAAEAETFAREGARVVFGDIRDVEGQKVEAGIRAAGGEAIYVHLDVTDEIHWQDAVETAVTRYGKLDILVNNAAIVIPRVPIEERTADEWDRVMAVNAKGVFLGTKYAIPAMRRAGGGSIVNISSVAGVYGNATQTNYAASKAGIIGFSRSLAKEVGRYGIRANVVAPGFIETDMTAELNEKVRKQALASIPLRRLGRAEEVADLVSFLVSERSSYITGAVFQIDGGIIL